MAVCPAGDLREFRASEFREIAEARILDDLGNDYADDLALTDSYGTDATTRVSMHTSLYCLLASQDGYGQSTLAKHWRIRAGITQSDTALTCELSDAELGRFSGGGFWSP